MEDQKQIQVTHESPRELIRQGKRKRKMQSQKNLPTQIRGCVLVHTSNATKEKITGVRYRQSQSREYDVNHNLLIKDINNNMLKQISLEIDFEWCLFLRIREINFNFGKLYSLATIQLFCFQSYTT